LQQTPGAPRDVAASQPARPGATHAETESLELNIHRTGASGQPEQVIAELASQGKKHDMTLSKSPALTGVETLAPQGFGSAPTAALQVQPARTLSSGNVETWREVVNQVRDGVVTTVEQNNREAHIQLDPPELGKLAIQLTVEGEQIRAHIVAESADVGALIQSHLPELKQALHSHRLDLDTVRVEVQTGGGESHTSSHHSHQEERASRRGRNFSPAQADAQDSETTLATPAVDRRGRVSVWA
jgi:flagellar hook-length control protein FliK